MRNRILALVLSGLAAAAPICAGAGVAVAQPSHAPQCFYSHDWDGWRATPDSRTIFIRVGVSRIWRLDLAAPCPELQAPNAKLITDQRGSSAICTALDINLKVADVAGFPVGCIVRDMAPLSREEASALPKSLRP
jgi:hypothetical protein